MSKRYIQIVSFDIAKINFAHYVEKIAIEELKNLKSKFDSRLKRRGMQQTEAYKDFVKQVYQIGERVHFGVFDLRNDANFKFLTMPTRRNIIDHLETNINVWEASDVVLIEQQFFSKRRSGVQANMDAIKISEVVASWFITTFPFKEIIIFPSKNKTKWLSAPLKLNDHKRKVWATQEAERVYTLRNDEISLQVYNLKQTVKHKRNLHGYIDEYLDSPEDVLQILKLIISKRQKLDDISDACLQCQAFKILELIMK